jgi:sigma-B regulation protein RsbU (phosphoserine phosphatase)
VTAEEIEADDRPVRPVHELQRVDAIMDQRLAALDAAGLLDELLARIQELLEVDTVAVLLLDHAAHQLVAHAARGLEEELRQGVRLPVGHGFAGRIAADRVPVMLDRVGPETVLNPILWTKGVKSMLGVPMLAGTTVMGVMHVGTLTPRRFTADDTRHLQLAADRIAGAITAEQASSERAAARTLQRSLLPPKLPDVRGAEFAARFVPSTELGVGGDWYDAFVLPSGRIGIVMGDVAGRGLPAAVVMGRMRSVLRGYALDCDGPAETLDRLDRKFAHFEPKEMATVLYAVAEPTLDRLTICLAGHPPPVMALPGQPATLLHIPASPPIGVHGEVRRTQVEVEVAPGATFGFYTDGLVERRTEAIDVGLERLRASFHAGPLQNVCSTVMAELIGSLNADDDIALLAFRRLEI